MMQPLAGLAVIAVLSISFFTRASSRSAATIVARCSPRRRFIWRAISSELGGTGRREMARVGSQGAQCLPVTDRAQLTALPFEKGQLDDSDHRPVCRVEFDRPTGITTAPRPLGKHGSGSGHAVFLVGEGRSAGTKLTSTATPMPSAVSAKRGRLLNQTDGAHVSGQLGGSGHM